MLLGPDFVGKFQNMPRVYKRLMGSAGVLSMKHANATVPNIKSLECPEFDTKEKRNSVIIEHWPDNIDFICLQEVWDKMSAMILMFKMRNHFSHFLTDVCQDLGNSNYIFRCKYAYMFLFLPTCSLYTTMF